MFTVNVFIQCSLTMFLSLMKAKSILLFKITIQYHIYMITMFMKAGPNEITSSHDCNQKLIKTLYQHTVTYKDETDLLFAGMANGSIIHI